MFQVSIRLDVQETAVLLPCELYELKAATLVRIPELQLLINLHDHFMELNINTGPCRISDVGEYTGTSSYADLDRQDGNTLVLSGEPVSYPL